MKATQTHFLSCLFAFVLLVSFPLNASAQIAEPEDSSPLDSVSETFYYTGISPVVLRKDDMEISLRNSFTSLWQAYYEYNSAVGAARVADRDRVTSLEHSVVVARGFAKNQRWDLGAELRYRHVRLDPDASSSPWKVLESGDNDPNGFSYRGLTWLGARLRAMPIARLPKLTLQGLVLFPIGTDLRKKQFLNANRIQASLSASYYEKFMRRTYFYLQAEWRQEFANLENERTTLTPSGGAYLVREFGRRKLYVIAGLTYSSNLEKIYEGGRLRTSSRFLLGYLSLQYQPARKFTIYLGSQAPLILESGSSHVQWVEDSFSSWSLGLRWLL